MINPLEKTAVGCWNPTTCKTKSNLYACGTVAGAFDASFSSNTELEIYEHSIQDNQQTMQKLVSIASPLRFCRLDWSASPSYSLHGLLAGGMEGGVVNVWNVESLLSSSTKDSPSALLQSQKVHEGMVKGISFNPIQSNVLASGAANADICVWDLNVAGKTVAPGAKSSKLDDISDLVWNPKVQHILASSSSNGSVVIWDLNQKREVIQMTIPNKYSVSAICWNPELPTQLFTACEDDSNPVVYGWDLRNAHAPEKSLIGHKKGILCMNWCTKDTELLATAGKDNSVLLWNPKTGEKTGQLPASENWIFDVRFSLRNPDILTGSSFDGKVNFYSLQEMTQKTQSLHTTPHGSTTSFSFDNLSSSTSASTQGVVEVKKIPRWLKRPVGCCFSFSGKLLSFSTANASVIFTKTIPEDELFFNTVVELENALATGQLSGYCEKRSSSIESISDLNPIESFWFMLSVGFDFSNRKQKLLKLLGLAKEELRDRLRKMSLAQQSSTSSTVESTVSLDSTSNSFSESSLESPTSPYSPRSVQPHSEEEFSKFITQSLIVGDFDAAVSYCRHANKWADALILAQCAGEELLEQTRTKYISQFRNESSYLPLAKNILSKDLSKIIEESSLSDWKEIMAIICTYAPDDQVKLLISQLGAKLIENKNYFAAICCFCCSFDFANFAKNIYSAIPEVLTEDYVHFISVLNYACGNVLFNPTLAHSIEERSFILSKFNEYSQIIAKEGLISYALMYCQMGEEVKNDDQKHLLFKYRLYTLCSSANKRYSAETPFTVLSPFVYAPAVEPQLQSQMISGGGSFQSQSQLNVQSQYHPQTYQQQPQQPYQQQQPLTQSYTQFQPQQLIQGMSAMSLQPQQSYAPPHSNQYSQVLPQPIVPTTMQQSYAPVPTPASIPVAPKGAWNDAPFVPPAPSPSAQSFQPSRPLVVTPPQQPTPRISPIGPPTIPFQQPIQQRIQPIQSQQPPFVQQQQQQTPRMQPIMPPPMQQTPRIQPQSIPQQSVMQQASQVHPPPVQQPSMMPPVPSQMMPPVPSQMMPQPTATQQTPPLMQSQQFVQQPPVATQTQQPTQQFISHPAVPQTQQQFQQPIQQPIHPIAQPTLQQPMQSAMQNLPIAQPQSHLPSQPQPPSQLKSPIIAPQPVAPQSAVNQGPMQANASSSSLPPVVQQPPVVKKPSGDSSNIPQEQLPIFNSFRSLLDFCKQRSPASQNRLLDDCEKRLVGLFDRMNNNQFSNEQVISQTLDLAKCINEKNLDQAMTIQATLYTSNYDEVGNWMVAVKRLIELAKKM